MGFSVSSSSSSSPPRKKYLFYGQELINYPFELDWIWNKIFFFANSISVINYYYSILKKISKDETRLPIDPSLLLKATREFQRCD